MFGNFWLNVFMASVTALYSRSVNFEYTVNVSCASFAGAAPGWSPLVPPPPPAAPEQDATSNATEHSSTRREVLRMSPPGTHQGHFFKRRRNVRPDDAMVR